MTASAARHLQQLDTGLDEALQALRRFVDEQVLLLGGDAEQTKE